MGQGAWRRGRGGVQHASLSNALWSLPALQFCSLPAAFTTADGLAGLRFKVESPTLVKNTYIYYIVYIPSSYIFNFLDALLAFHWISVCTLHIGRSVNICKSLSCLFCKKRKKRERGIKTNISGATDTDPLACSRVVDARRLDWTRCEKQNAVNICTPGTGCDITHTHRWHGRTH